MLNMLQQMLNQQAINNPQTPEDELLIHQEPLAAAMRTLFKLIEYEKRLLPAEVFTPMIQSLQDNMNQTFEQMKVPNIPANSEIVSINGEKVN